MPLLDYLSFLDGIQNFSYPTALAGLLLILPLILLYLLKPKPKHIMIPTIMFIHRIEKEKRFSSFLKRFIRDPLLLMQIIIISLLVLAIAAPYLTSLMERNPEQDVVVVIDSSASMQSRDVSPDRFTKALEMASDIIGSMNDESRASIVLAGDLPIQLAYYLQKGDAMSALQGAKCLDSSANIPDSMVYAITILAGSEKKKMIYVLSDFSQLETEGMDLVRKLALNRNITVEFINIGGGGSNTGFIFADAERFVSHEDRIHLTLNVRNFNDRVEEVLIEIMLDDNSVKDMNEEINPYSEKLLGVDLDASSDSHFIKVKLLPEDDLTLDNNIVLYLPPVRRYNVLLITDDDADNFLGYAIDASPSVRLEKASFPVIPSFQSFDSVILGRFSEELSIPGVFQELRRYVLGGGNLVVVSSDSIDNRAIEGLLPVSLGKLITGKKQVNLLLRHKILKDVLISNLIVERYYETTPLNDSTVIATVGSYPVLSYWGVGEGKVFFLGINPSKGWSNFYLSSSLPIFSLQLINWINAYESQTAENNFKTGDYFISTEDVTIYTPSGLSFKSKNLLLDGVGIYRINYTQREGVISVNLFNERESDISNSSPMGDYTDEFRRKQEVYQNKQDLSRYLIVVVLLFLLLEIVVYRRRGRI